jgi:hypothetical protein
VIKNDIKYFFAFQSLQFDGQANEFALGKEMQVSKRIPNLKGSC